MIFAALLALAVETGANSLPECLFYLKPVPEHGVEAHVRRLPGRDMLFFRAAALPESVFWDKYLEKARFRVGDKVHEAPFQPYADPKRLAVIPPELVRNIADFWLDKRTGRVRLATLEPEKLGIWEHVPESGTWDLVKRERFYGEDSEMHASNAMRKWRADGASISLTELIEDMRAPDSVRRAHRHARDESAGGTAVLDILDKDGCSLKLTIETAKDGIHAAAPLILTCAGEETGRVLLDAGTAAGFDRVAFALRWPWLVGGAEADVAEAKLFRLDGKPLKPELPRGVSHAAFLPECPKALK